MAQKILLLIKSLIAGSLIGLIWAVSVLGENRNDYIFANPQCKKTSSPDDKLNEARICGYKGTAYVTRGSLSDLTSKLLRENEVLRSESVFKTEKGAETELYFNDSIVARINAGKKPPGTFTFTPGMRRIKLNRPDVIFSVRQIIKGFLSELYSLNAKSLQLKSLAQSKSQNRLSLTKPSLCFKKVLS